MGIPPTSRTLSRAEGLAATLLGAGRFPRMPGTAGSILAIVPCFFLPPRIYPWAMMGGILLATLFSVLIARRLPPESPDPGWFVLDEAAGVWVAAFAFENPGVVHLMCALALFRLFDIWKPFPIRALERVGGGFGIVLDDLAAGAYALGLILAVAQFTT